MTLARVQAIETVELILSPKRVRVLLGGMFIADSQRVLLLRGQGRPPEYYFPSADVRSEALAPGPKTGRSPRCGAMQYWHVGSGDARRENAAWRCPETVIGDISLADYIAFDWGAMDAWFEEDEEVYIHPRDPFTRIDVLQSSRHVQVKLDGTIIADSKRPVLLLETGLPVRYYLPRLDVRMDLLMPSDTVTRCPYKGEAHYYSVMSDSTVAEDLFWYYRYTTNDMTRIAGLLSFLPEKANEVLIDGAPVS